jgi:hypothetical protein
MTYDPRPVSQGGNKGIDEEFSRAAPIGKYRVVCVDTFDGGDWLHGDFDTAAEAISAATTKGGTMLKTHVYDDTGRHIFQAGNF